MPSRPIWKGFVQFSLVSIPVQAHTATVAEGEGVRAALNQLHRDCGSRIRYRKTCPLHGEVRNDEIVSGFEFSPGRYVEVRPEELDAIRSPKEKAFDIEAFLEEDVVDPAYFSGRTWYLLPEGKPGMKPFVLLRRAMAESGRIAFARIAASGRKQSALLRPVGDVIAASMLTYDVEVKRPGEFESEVVPVEVGPEELQLARSLADRLAVRDFDLAAYRDDYADKLAKVIEAKVAGQQIVAPPAPAEAPVGVINLMAALQKSLDKTKRAAASKPSRLVAPVTADKARASRRRKSS